MKSRPFGWLFFFFAVALPSPAFAAEQAVHWQDFHIKNSNFKTSTEVRDVLPPGPEPRSEVENAASSLVSLYVKGVQNKKPLERDLQLAHFDSRIFLTPQPDGTYTVRIVMGIRRSDGTSKEIEQTVSVDPKQTFELGPDFVTALGQQFAALAQGELASYQKEYGDKFNQILGGFAVDYAGEISGNASDLMKQTAATKVKQIPVNPPVPAAAPAPSAPETPPAAEPASAAPAEQEASQEDLGTPRPDVRQSHYQKTEGLEFSEIASQEGKTWAPRYTSTIRFDLAKRGTPDLEWKPWGRVRYRVSTVPVSSEEYQTTFKVILDYGKGKVKKTTYSKTLSHGPAVRESSFFREWRKEFWEPSSGDFFTGKLSAEAERARLRWLSDVESFLIEEFFDFSSFLSRAQAAFTDAPALNQKENVPQEGLT